MDVSFEASLGWDGDLPDLSDVSFPDSDPLGDDDLLVFESECDLRHWGRIRARFIVNLYERASVTKDVEVYDQLLSDASMALFQFHMELFMVRVKVGSELKMVDGEEIENWLVLERNFVCTKKYLSVRQGVRVGADLRVLFEPS